ncbi:uncharacterized protein TERG_00927 [Trichophyton rubrum CBS 118892]|uniref:Mitochondrial distribution and morphology protein 35 n=1 Tax=Trichophyton rubrum (strain ATCC MYA-4607 / CBS 118892) TaxID=559305 RepID=F2SE26_TRIRC|nr:uncharacterized protein TERG_00927 [Trichophyton rubrum CBS 118892]EGD84651.2 hypothetical protein TERG_00927 [Trichophyton rubrum CBS 118892]
MSASLAPECNEIKERYDSCFLKWYSEKFLRGNTSTNECEEVFQQYKKCLFVSKTTQSSKLELSLNLAEAGRHSTVVRRGEKTGSLSGGRSEGTKGVEGVQACQPANIQQRTLKEKGIDVMLDEARSSNREQDADFLSKKSK